MVIISDSDKQKVQRKLMQFMTLYGDKYEPYYKEYIDREFLGTSFEKNVEKDLMDQVYSATGVYDNIPNIYDTFIEEMLKHYSIDGNLVEVAAGFYPGLSEKISLRQKSGTIIIYEPKIIVESNEKFKIIKESITESTMVNNVDLIYALRPHAATETIIKMANKNDVDMFIGLCGCIPFLNYDDFDDLSYGISDWYHDLEELVKKTLPSNRNYEMYKIPNLKRPIIRTYRR